MIRSLDDHRTVATPPPAEETPLSRYAWRCIHNAAAGISQQQGFSPSDREDLTQELAIRLWQGLAPYGTGGEEALGLTSVIVKRVSASLMRKHYSRKRGWGLEQHSLPTECRRDDEPWPGFREHEAFSAEKERTTRAIDLRLDIALVMKRLPPYLRSLAEQLQTCSVREIAAAEGLSAWQIYSRIKRLRRFFAHVH